MALQRHGRRRQGQHLRRQLRVRPRRPRQVPDGRPGARTTRRQRRSGRGLAGVPERIGDHPRWCDAHRRPDVRRRLPRVRDRGRRNAHGPTPVGRDPRHDAGRLHPRRRRRYLVLGRDRFTGDPSRGGRQRDRPRRDSPADLCVCARWRRRPHAPHLVCPRIPPRRGRRQGRGCDLHDRACSTLTPVAPEHRSTARYRCTSSAGT